MKKIDIMSNRDLAKAKALEEEKKKVVGPIVREAIKEIVIVKPKKEIKTKVKTEIEKEETKRWQK